MHKAPDWWKELQARRKRKSKGTAKANVADESKTTPEMANITAEHLIDCLQDGYESYACIYAGEKVESAAEVWSGMWNEQTTTLSHTKGPEIVKTGEEQACAATSTPCPYCIDSGCTSHCSPVCSDFTHLEPIPHRPIRGMNGDLIPAVGMGTIKLRCGKGRKLTLKNALFVPDAAL